MSVPAGDVIAAPGTATSAVPEAATTAGATQLLQICLTAEEAYPLLEAEFLGARREIHASFRVFDPDTNLISDAARAIGTTWTDLLAHVLGQGVHVTLTLADFDAIARPDLHRGAHAHAGALRALAERVADADRAAGAGATVGRLTVRLAAHPARMGFLPRLALLPVMRKELREQADALNELSAQARAEALADMPGLVRYLRQGRSGRVRPRPFVLPHVLPVTHHQKLAVFDQSRVYIGGLDLDNRRFDTLRHDQAAGETWYDVHLLLQGPVAREAQSHLDRFHDETAGRQAPSQSRELLRTLSRARRLPMRFIGPRPVLQELQRAHLDRIKVARSLIYIETQFMRDVGLARALARRGRSEPELNLVLVVPAAPEEVAFDGARGAEVRHADALQVRCLKMLADAFGPRFFAVSPVQPRRAEGQFQRDTIGNAPIVYVHAKVAVFDETTAIVSSANLNGRSLRWDTEAGVALDKTQDVIDLRNRCMGHWIGEARYAANPESYAKAQTWRALAHANAAREPENRRGFVMPYPWARARDFAEALPGFPDDVV